MNFEPQKLFIGLVDVFSILMPGALLVYLGKDWAATKFGLTKGFPLDSTEATAVFLFASYLFGHFAFSICHYRKPRPHTRKRLPQSGFVQTGLWEVMTRLPDGLSPIQGLICAAIRLTSRRHSRNSIGRGKTTAYPQNTMICDPTARSGERKNKRHRFALDNFATTLEVAHADSLKQHTNERPRESRFVETGAESAI